MPPFHPNPQVRRSLESAEKSMPVKPRKPGGDGAMDKSEHSGGDGHASHTEHHAKPEGGYKHIVHGHDGSVDEHHHDSLDEGHQHDKEVFGEQDGSSQECPECGGEMKDCKCETCGYEKPASDGGSEYGI